jgi:DNA-directed RNA polymerase specialized sigma24 family protein
MQTTDPRPKGRPATPPPTLKALYQGLTGDTTAHQRAIHGRLLRLSPRRRLMVQARVEGLTLRQIAGKVGGISHGTVASAIAKAMEAIRKDIAGEARYNHRPQAGSETGPAAVCQDPSV